ncbi:diguanylate cyclase [Desulforamulus putei]|nr:diguanylate cyclase [Desulforamulus putei]
MPSAGHQCGDDALKHVARAIKMSIRQGDVAIRYGGDEFAILFPYKGPRPGDFAGAAAEIHESNLP